MLTVPIEKPDEKPLNPELQQNITSIPDSITLKTTPKDATPEQTEQTLNHTVVKDLLTTLHQDLDSHLTQLCKYTGAHIADITTDHDTYLTEQIHNHKNALKNPQQQQLFDHMTKELFTKTKSQAYQLYRRKVQEYQSETIQRQNAELVRRTVAKENLFDDKTQTQYRNMILFNLETVYQDLEEHERRERLDAASVALYREIMDNRLEEDPERLDAILSAPAVRRALGEEETKKYEDKVEAARNDRTHRRMALEWVEEGMDPTEAQREAAKIKEEKSRENLLSHYHHLRCNTNERKALTHILNIQSAWAAVKEGDYKQESIPAWVIRNHPQLHGLIRDLLTAWQDNGGMEPEPDYEFFVNHMTNTNRYRIWEELADEEKAHSFARALGGVEGWAFDAASRKILTKSTAEDAALVKDLRLAQQMFETLDTEDERNNGSGNRFLAIVYHNRSRKLERLGVKQLLFPELAELVQASISEFDCNRMVK